MDRCAIFADAGHILAQSGILLLGTTKRASIACDYGALIGAIAGLSSAHCGLPLLRTYWYDAARDGIPTVDEDLREGVVAAQDMGVRVVVVGIPGPPGTRPNQAVTLLREADDHVVLERGFLTPPLNARPVGMMPFAPVVGVADEPRREPPQGTSVEDVGVAFARRWVEQASREEIHALLVGAPRIPVVLDSQLLRAAEETQGSLRGQDALRRGLRAAFWRTIRQANE